MPINSVVQFNENHEWCGTLGIITEVEEYCDDTRYMVSIPVPEQGAAYMFSWESKNELEYIGEAALIPADNDEEEEKT